MSAPNGEKINRKKLEHMERRRKKEEAKNTKTKLKKLARIVERKKIKQTRDSLISQLSEFQVTKLEGLIPTSKISQKDVEIVQPEIVDEKSSRRFPKKLRCVSGRHLVQKEREQLNHYETGSSDDSDSDNEIFNVVPNTNQSLEIIDDGDVIPEVMDEAYFEKTQKRKNADTKCLINNDVEDEKVVKCSSEYYKQLATIKGVTASVARLTQIESQRQKLPIHAEEQEIVEKINDNTVVVISGETGSGKTTQIPQFLYEAGYTSNGHLIAVTQPRRIAAISMADRVGKELCDPSLSSYQIRFEGNRTERTKVLFMTDGVLLRELQEDVTLSKFSVVIIDEAHERSIYSDVLIGLLSRICVARLKRGTPLKLIIMSATLQLSDFLNKRLFPNINPAVISVESRQFPVIKHFEKHTPFDYMKAAFRKVCKIHERLPDGGVLVFVSGQREVELLIKWLRLKYPPASDHSNEEKKLRKRKRKILDKADNKESNISDDLVADYEEFGAADVDRRAMGDENDDEEICSDIDEEDFGSDDDERRSSGVFSALCCLPLYSLLSSEKQQLIFSPIPNGTRLCVVATNVAETSLTIPNIRYVVDTGKEKRRKFDPITGVSQFCVEWISRASAEQRAGRAGRVQAGHAYRLYSSAVFEDFCKVTPPDILNQSIDQLVLHLKAMNFAKLTNFPFPTPPCSAQIEMAEQRLIHLKALERKSKHDDALITPSGRTLAKIPLSPQFANLVALSNQEALMPYALTMVAVLSIREPLQSVVEMRRDTAEATQHAMAEMLKRRRAWCSVGEARRLGDLCVLLNIIGTADNEKEVTWQYLEELGLRPKTYFEIKRLRRQLVGVINASTSLAEKMDPNFKLTPPSQTQMRLLREALCHCLSDQIAKRVARTADNSDIPKDAYQCQRLQDYVFIDSTSMLYKDQPDYVLYQDIVQISAKKCMQMLSVVEEEWIPEFIKRKLEE